MILLAGGFVTASAPASPHQHEIRDVRDHLLESFAFPPVHLNDSTTVVRVERYWDDEIRVHLESGHTLRVTVELDSY